MKNASTPNKCRVFASNLALSLDMQIVSKTVLKSDAHDAHYCWFLSPIINQLFMLKSKNHQPLMIRVHLHDDTPSVTTPLAEPWRFRTSTCRRARLRAVHIGVLVGDCPTGPVEEFYCLVDHLSSWHPHEEADLYRHCRHDQPSLDISFAIIMLDLVVGPVKHILLPL